MKILSRRRSRIKRTTRTGGSAENRRRFRNPKSEYRNPKEIRNSNFLKKLLIFAVFRIFRFPSDFEFPYLPAYHSTDIIYQVRLLCRVRDWEQFWLNR